jgi:hypothetical protein
VGVKARQNLCPTTETCTCVLRPMSYPQGAPLDKKQRGKKAGTNKQVHISHFPINHQQQQPLLLKLVFVHSSPPPRQALAAARPSDPRHVSPTCFLASSTPDQRSSRSVLRQLSSVPTRLSAGRSLQVVALVGPRPQVASCCGVAFGILLSQRPIVPNSVGFVRTVDY